MKEEYSPAIHYLSDLMASRDHARKQWKKDAGDLIGAHELAFSALVKMIQRHSAKRIDKPEQHVEGQICLIAQFLIGIEVCETAISEGMYSQASALLKQELETIAGIDEYNNGTRKEGVTPKMSKTGPTAGFGPVYGRLNEICHVSRHEIAKNLVTGQVGETVGANIMPIYNKDLALFLYAQHVHYITLVARQADVLFESVYGAGISDEEKTWVGTAISIMLKSGLMDASPTAPEEAAEYIRATKNGELPAA